MHFPVTGIHSLPADVRAILIFSSSRSAHPPGNQIAHLSQTLIGAKQSYRSVTSVWYNGIAPFSLEFAWDGFGSPFFISVSRTGFPVYRNLKASLRSASSLNFHLPWLTCIIPHFASLVNHFLKILSTNSFYSRHSDRNSNLNSATFISL